MSEAIISFVLAEVSLFGVTQGKKHWKFCILNNSLRTETWALQMAWKNESSIAPPYVRLPRKILPPWGGSFSLGLMTLYPQQMRVIEVFSEPPVDGHVIEDELELHWQFFFDERFGSVHVSKVIQTQG